MSGVRNFLAAVLAAAGMMGTCAAFAQEEEDWAVAEKEAFRRTVAEVDSDGNMLLYWNATGILENLERMLGAFDQISEVSPFDDAEKLQQISVLFRTLLSSLRLYDVQSAAFSSKTAREESFDTIYQHRAFLYTGGRAAGLFGNLMGWMEQPFTLWKSLPSEAVFAFEGFWDPASLWHSIRLERNAFFGGGGGPVLIESRDYFTELETLIRETLGVEPDRLLSGMTGRYAGFSVMNNESGRFLYYLTVPDRDGVLWEVLEKKLAGSWKKEGGQILYYDLDEPFGRQRMMLRYADGCVTFSSSERIRRLVSGGAGMVTVPEIAPFYFEELPRSGSLFLYLNLPRGVIDSLLLRGGERTLEQISREFSPPVCAAVMSASEDGYRLVARSNWGVPTLGKILPGLLTLSALNEFYDELSGSTRNNESCEANLSRIDDALDAYYAANGKLPSAGLAGLNELAERKLLTFADLVCGRSAVPAKAVPLTENGCSYIYLGPSGTKEKRALPLVIDKPGNHTGCFNVLYDDGEIESVRVDDGADLTALILTLGAQREYSSDGISALMNKLIEFGWVSDGRSMLGE